MDATRREFLKSCALWGAAGALSLKRAAEQGRLAVRPPPARETLALDGPYEPGCQSRAYYAGLPGDAREEDLRRRRLPAFGAPGLAQIGEWT